MRVLLALLALLPIAACVPEGQPRLHEIVLYGAENTRLTYLYGTPTTLMLGEREVELQRANGDQSDPLVLIDALSIDGRDYLRDRIAPLDSPPSEVRAIARSSDLQVSVSEDTGPILYYDGRMWFTLLGDGRAGVDTRVVPRPRIGGLRGVGELTRSEADALTRYLEEQGPVAVTVLDDVPAPRRTADGVSEYSRTGLFLQRDFATAAASPRPRPQELVWEVIAQGMQASGFEDETFVIVQDDDTLRSLWNRAHGSQLQVPPVPEADFRRETVVALFLGTRPTGGYAIEVAGVTVEGGEAVVDVRIVEPAPDAFTTQALTSPWTMVRILRGGLGSVWIREAGSDRLLGAATPAP